MVRYRTTLSKRLQRKRADEGRVPVPFRLACGNIARYRSTSFDASR
jgi:hypothetical protein